jgi:putative Ca2+/H+ antiporter (TMEM165/GDT1 family)
MIDRSEYTLGLDKFLNGLADVDKFSSSSSSSSSRLLASLMDMTGFWKGFTSSLAMILATEVGDKTFFIAAVLSMKHDRSAVFIGAFLALIVMTILSTAMGLVLPRFMDKKYTHILSGILFLYFGVKLILDSRGMEGGKVSEELEEVEEELLQQGSKKKGDDEELGQQQRSTKSSSAASSNKMNNTAATSTSYTSIIITSLTLTFVAEWGDRSQIATIALASAKNPAGVTIGCLLGHAICTSAACIGGRMLASSISEKTVSLWGGVVFLLFGAHSLFFETSAEASSLSSSSP